MCMLVEKSRVFKPLIVHLLIILCSHWLKLGYFSKIRTRVLQRIFWNSMVNQWLINDDNGCHFFNPNGEGQGRIQPTLFSKINFSMKNGAGGLIFLDFSY